MKAFIVSISICFYFFSSQIFAQKYLGELAETEFHLSEKKLNFIVNVFETKKQLVDFLEIKKGDVVAEIGANDGINLGVLSTVYDSVTFYAQDINPKALTKRKLDKTITYYSKHKQTPQTNTFKRVIGTINSSNLPTGIFDEIFLIDAYHDFDEKDNMLDDIYTKLKPGGKLILMDGSSFIGDTIICKKAGCHVFPMLDVEIKRCAKHGLYLTKMRNPNFFASNYGNATIYEKDKLKSENYIKLKNAIDPLAAQAYRLKKKEIASDSVIVKQIADSLISKIKEITTVYPEFEVWLKDIAITHMWKLRYQSAINILKENVRFYPNSYQAFYWLGVAYQEKKQYNLALQNFNQSLVLNPSNVTCDERIQAVKKKP
jgi:tetratricopeptide (TPR) repeat protein